jgi:hypothetical protein
MDLENAYNHVNWVFPFLFLFFVVVTHVEKMQVWGEVVLLDNSFISSIRFLVLVNGSSTNFFSSSQGLR